MKKTRIFGSLMAVALMLGTTAGIPEMFTGVQDSSIMTVDAAVTYPVRQTNKKVSLMKTAGGNDKVITLSSGVYVSEMTCTTKNGTRWYKVRYQKRVNGSMKKYDGWAKENDIPYIPTKIMRTTDRLNIRPGASTNNTPYTTIPMGDTVHVLNYKANSAWQKVVWNGITGYCNTAYLR